MCPSGPSRPLWFGCYTLRKLSMTLFHNTFSNFARTNDPIADAQVPAAIHSNQIYVFVHLVTNFGPPQALWFGCYTLQRASYTSRSHRVLQGVPPLWQGDSKRAKSIEMRVLCSAINSTTRRIYCARRVPLGLFGSVDIRFNKSFFQLNSGVVFSQHFFQLCKDK